MFCSPSKNTKNTWANLNCCQISHWPHKSVCRIGIWRNQQKLQNRIARYTDWKNIQNSILQIPGHLERKRKEDLQGPFGFAADLVDEKPARASSREDETFSIFLTKKKFLRAPWPRWTSWPNFWPFFGHFLAIFGHFWEGGGPHFGHFFLQNLIDNLSRFWPPFLAKYFEPPFSLVDD